MLYRSQVLSVVLVVLLYTYPCSERGLSGEQTPSESDMISRNSHIRSESWKPDAMDNRDNQQRPSSPTGFVMCPKPSNKPRYTPVTITDEATGYPVTTIQFWVSPELRNLPTNKRTLCLFSGTTVDTVLMCSTLKLIMNRFILFAE